MKFFEELFLSILAVLGSVVMWLVNRLFKRIDSVEKRINNLEKQIPTDYVSKSDLKIMVVNNLLRLERKLDYLNGSKPSDDR